MPRIASTRARVHRDLHFHAADRQRGADVAALQRAINARAKRRGIHPALKVDGDCGRQTIAKGRQVALALGLVLSKPGLSKGAQAIIRVPVLRTPAQIRRAKHYAPPVADKQPTVKGNSVEGGTPRERVRAAALQAAHLFYIGAARRFYSQAGAWTVDHAITGEQRGERSDCSQFVTGLSHAAHVADPNGTGYTGGYTGTLGAHGTYIRRDQLAPGDLVLYGPAPHHHVELYVGSGDRTVGHGSPPVDFGEIDMIADPHFCRPPGLGA